MTHVMQTPEIFCATIKKQSLGNDAHLIIVDQFRVKISVFTNPAVGHLDKILMIAHERLLMWRDECTYKSNREGPKVSGSDHTLLTLLLRHYRWFTDSLVYTCFAEWHFLSNSEIKGRVYQDSACKNSQTALKSLTLHFSLLQQQPLVEVYESWSKSSLSVINLRRCCLVCLSVCYHSTCFSTCFGIHSLRHPIIVFLCFSWIVIRTFLKKLPFEGYGVKSQYAVDLELTSSCFHVLSGPTKMQKLLKGQLVGQMLLQMLATGATGVKQVR